MKEAAGEANITVITIVLIGVVAAVGIIFIPKLLGSVQMRSNCTGEYEGKFGSGNRCYFDESNPYYEYHHAYCTMKKCADGTTHAGEYWCDRECNL